MNETLHLHTPIKLANRMEGIEEYFFSKKLKQIADMNKSGKKVINLGIGSPDLPPHPEVIRTLNDAASKANNHSYQSYRGSEILRTEIADWYQQWYGVKLNPGEEIVPLMGSKEGIMHICMTYLNPGDEVLIPDPGYPTYRSAATIAGANCIPYSLKEENNYHPSIDDLASKDLSRVKIMFVNYPHMPTGTAATHELFEKLISFAAEHEILIVHDNPYSFLFPENSNQKPLSIFSIAGAKDCAIELNSLSKSHNMAGWRVGCLIGNAERINEVLKFKTNMDSGMFLPVQLAAAKALTLDAEWYASLNKIYLSRRKKVEELLFALGCEFKEEQQGLFVWARIPSGYSNSYTFSDYVLNQFEIFITPGAIFGEEGNKYCRASLCMNEELIEEAIARIKNFQQ